MLKKLFMFIAIFMASVNFAMAQSAAGSYNGTLDVVKMNDNNYNPVENQTFEVSSNLKLTGTVKKVGKMPGDIVLSMNLVQNGNTSTCKDNVCGKLNILGFIPASLYLSSFSGSIDGNNIEFTIECDGLYKGSSIHAKVHYKGTKE